MFALSTTGNRTHGLFKVYHIAVRPPAGHNLSIPDDLFQLIYVSLQRKSSRTACRWHSIRSAGGKSGQFRALRFLTGSSPRGLDHAEENNRLLKRR